MNFKETLTKAKKNQINAIKLKVATEVESCLSNMYTNDEEFEKLCKLVYDAYMADDSCRYSIEVLANAVERLIVDESPLTVEGVLKNAEELLIS